MFLKSKEDIKLKRGQKSPLSFFQKLKGLITEEAIKKAASEGLQGTENFLVDIIIRPGNKIQVLIDNPHGLSIKDCAKLSRQIESEFNRDVEDFELEVSSPGADRPFKVIGQYLKNIGRSVEVTTEETEKIVGTLISADENGIVIETAGPGKAKPVKEKKQISLNYKQIKSTKGVISFK